MKMNGVLEGTKKNIGILIGIGASLGVTITIEDCDGTATATASPKEKQTTKKQTSSKKKSDDSFDRAKYLSVAERLGCLGKHGVWKACRPTVYKVMDGTLSEAKGKAEVKAFAKANGWKLTNAK